jgi:hypothetical protein
MTYLYGLADFFTVMFQDTSTVNLLLESTTQASAEIYSQFLQLTSTLSLEGIGKTVGSSINLVLINSTDAVAGSLNTFSISSNTILSTRYIANKPFLPTTMLEQNVDFGLVTSSDGSTTITFAQSIDSYSFSVRANKDGSKQYALWFVDAEIDERLISKYYGNLIGATPQNSTDAFYSFIYGLYYVYVQGPTLDVIRKGLNLTLGIPLARSAETVLDIRNYLTTNDYIVITDQNQYLIPYGLSPSVSIGQSLVVGDELAQWVVIQDYISDGAWWINLQIPPTIIPTLPDGQKDRYATEGSHFDYLMSNYLKKHTFLVKVNVGNFENLQTYQQLSTIINKAKPTYTQPIYIWTIDTLVEELTLSEASLKSQIVSSRCENLGLPIDRFYRGNNVDAPTRGCAQFIRFNVPYWVTKICGTDPYVNGDPGSMTLNGNDVTGFTDYVTQYRTNTGEELAWIRAILQRNSETWRGSVTQVGFRRTQIDPTILDGTPINVSSSSWKVPVGVRVVPLYITTITDINNKSAAIGTPPPSPQQWSFPLFGAYSNTRAINTLAIDGGIHPANSKILIDNFNTLFFRDVSVGYLSAAIPDETGWKTYAPLVGDIKPGDYLLGIRIINQASTDIVGVYWVTSNDTVGAPIYFPVSDPDPLTVIYKMPLTRMGGLNGTPLYLLRGRGTLNYNNVGTAINEAAINTHRSVASPALNQVYIDKYNPLNMPINRSGIAVNHAIESE